MHGLNHPPLLHSQLDVPFTGGNAHVKYENTGVKLTTFLSYGGSNLLHILNATNVIQDFTATVLWVVCYKHLTLICLLLQTYG